MTLKISQISFLSLCQPQQHKKLLGPQFSPPQGCSSPSAWSALPSSEHSLVLSCHARLSFWITSSRKSFLIKGSSLATSCSVILFNCRHRNITSWFSYCSFPVSLPLPPTVSSMTARVLSVLCLIISPVSSVARKSLINAYGIDEHNQQFGNKVKREMPSLVDVVVQLLGRNYF